MRANDNRERTSGAVAVRSRRGRVKVVLCAEFQGEGAVRGSTTGFQRSVDEIIEQAGCEGELDVVVYCMGTSRRDWQHPRFSNVLYRQYRPNLSVWEGVPGTSFDLFPFMVDLLPLHPVMLRDLIVDAPDVIHTFQTFGATDLAGYVAAHWLRRRGREVRLVNSIVTEIDTYFGHYVRRIMGHFCDRMDALGLWGSIRDVRSRPFAKGPRSRLAPIAIVLWWTLVKVADVTRALSNGARRRRAPIRYQDHALPALFSRLYRAALEREIPRYLEHCDAVTTSRPEDGHRYALAKPAWHVPHACDRGHFRVLEQRAAWIGEQLVRSVVAAGLPEATVAAIERLVTDPIVGVRRPVLHVGRLSDEKNFGLVLEAYGTLIDKAGEGADVHLVCVGAGVDGEEALRIHGDAVSVCGLLPNSLLPLVYNLVRVRGGFLVSASDTETYGIVHQEASACGVPIVAMERGTRTHLFAAGDRVGHEQIANDPSTAGIMRLLAADSLGGEIVPEGFARPGPGSRGAKAQQPSPLIFARNGLVVCDRSGGAGLASLLPDDPRRTRMRHAFAAAVAVLARLPERDMQRLSAAANELTHAHRASWATIWQLFERVYADDRESHAALVERHQHCPVEQQERVGKRRALGAATPVAPSARPMPIAPSTMPAESGQLTVPAAVIHARS